MTSRTGHYQFAGRADLLAWSIDGRQLLHSEHRTRFPNIQEAFGSYNAKRRYLPGVIADRVGLRGGFASISHVMVCAWSSEALAAVRRHRASFQAVCPDPPDAFDQWLAGRPPTSGVTSSMVFLDPVASGRQRLYVGLGGLDGLRPRHRGYADLAALVGS